MAQPSNYRPRRCVLQPQGPDITAVKCDVVPVRNRLPAVVVRPGVQGPTLHRFSRPGMPEVLSLYNGEGSGSYHVQQKHENVQTLKCQDVRLPHVKSMDLHLTL
jgi:hypothetical protein